LNKKTPYFTAYLRWVLSAWWERVALPAVGAIRIQRVMIVIGIRCGMLQNMA